MPKVADFIEQHREALVQRYVQEAGRLPSARAATPAELIDTLYEYLGALVASSRQGTCADCVATLKRLEETHLSLRMRLGYTQSEVVEEYVLLGRLLSSLWTDLPPEAQPSASDAQLLFDALQGAMDHAVAVFSGYTAEDRQREKSLLRRLDVRAAEALDEAAARVPLGQRLEPLLEVVMEAMGADMAALFLLTDEGRALVLTASVGLGAQPPGSWRAPLSPDSFLGRVALSEEPFQLADVAAQGGDLALRPALRNSGVHTLLGTRLWPNGKLLGALSVGRARVLPYTPRERRTFEMLSEYLSSIVDRASLFDQVREREERYQLALEATADIIWEWDVATDALRWSDALKRHFGYAPGQVVHSMEFWRSHMHPEDAERVFNDVHRFVRSGGTRWQVEYRFLRADGSWAHVIDRGVLKRAPDGTPLRMVGAMQDVTAERVARASLQHSEERLRLVLDTVPMLLNFVDCQQRYVLNNRAYRDWFGVEPEALKGRTVREVVGEENYRHLRPHLERALSGEQVEAELPFDFGGGRHGFIHGTFEPFLTASGEQQGYVALVQDITERRALEAERQRAVEALRRSEQQFRTLAESMPAIIWSATPDGRLDYINQYLTEITGMSTEQALGTGWAELLHPGNRPVAEAAWKHALETGSRYEVELHLRTRDGGYRWHLVRGFPVRDAQGRIERWLGATTDIEGLKQAQAEAQRRADFEEKLIGIVSHDLRNPLNAILLAVQTLLRRRGLDERQAAALSRVRGSAERMQRMIRDLLDFTQARLRGGIPVTRAPVDVHALVRQVADEVGLAHPGREVQVSVEGEGQGLFDADRVAQLLTNLLGNAIAYSPEGTPVRVDARGEDGAVVLEVHNQGPPIPPEQLQRLFQPLERGDLKGGSAERSIGLGLFIVASIAQAHGGRVDVRSSAEEGTRFSVWLPRR
jgi:PAS domain S-box-containing protein